MIQVTVSEREQKIVSMDIQGHAGYDVYGHDLVCALVSGIAVGLCNALDELAGVKDMTVEDGHVVIKVDRPDANTELILRTGLIQLETAEEVNKDFVTIKISEV